MVRGWTNIQMCGLWREKKENVCARRYVGRCIAVWPLASNFRLSLYRLPAANRPAGDRAAHERRVGHTRVVRKKGACYFMRQSVHFPEEGPSARLYRQ